MNLIFYICLITCLVTQPFNTEERIKVKIHSYEGDYIMNKGFVDSAAQLLEEILNSDEFKNEILNKKFSWDNDLSNQEIYNEIVKAHELQGPGGQSNVVDLRVRTLSEEKDGKRWMDNCEINSRAGTIGIDGNNDGVIATCPQRLNLWKKEDNLPELTGHIAHEYMHLIGFMHPSWGKRRQNKTLVYKVGNIVSQIAKNKLSTK